MCDRREPWPNRCPSNQEKFYKYHTHYPNENNMMCFGVLILLRVLVDLFFGCCWFPLLLMSRSLMHLGGLRSLKMFNSLPDKFYLVIWTQWIDFWVRSLCSWGVFVVFFVGRQRNTWITFSGVVSLRDLKLPCQRDVRKTIKEFLLHPPFKEKGWFLWFAGVCFIVRYFWERNNRVQRCGEGPWWCLILGEVPCFSLGFGFKTLL